MSIKAVPSACVECHEVGVRRIHALCQRCFHRLYYKEHREQLIAKAQEWKRANPDRYLAGRRAIAKRRYHTLTPEQRRDKDRQRAEKMTPVERDKRSQRSKEWYRLNRIRHLQTQRRWRARYPERWREIQRMATQRRYARKKALPSTLTREQWEAIKVAYDYRCAYCERKMERLTQDHVIALSNGGGYTAENIVPACQSCNSKKGARMPLTLVKVLLL